MKNLLQSLITVVAYIAVSVGFALFMWYIIVGLIGGEYSFRHGFAFFIFLFTVNVFTSRGVENNENHRK